MGHPSGVFAGAPVKRGVFKCTQSSTDAPAIGTTVLNELGSAPTFAYTSPGVYTITLTGAFTLDKTFCRAQAVTPLEVAVAYTDVNTITLTFSDLATPSAAESGDFDLEIVVYF